MARRGKMEWMALALLVAVWVFALISGAAIPAWGSTLTVTNTGDLGSGSLRQAITDANNMAGDDTIIFGPGVEGEIKVRSALPELSSVRIEGPGANRLTVQPFRDARTNTEVRLFAVRPEAIAFIDGLTIDGGRAPGGDGGGVYNPGTLEITNSTISGNVADGSGGGIFNSGTLRVENSTVCGNTSSDGGGIYSARDSTLTVVESTVCTNAVRESGSGGGISNAGALTVESSTISGNDAFVTVEDTGEGGGIFNAGTLELTNDTVSGNRSNAGGGGIHNASEAVIQSSTVTRNSSQLGGGGIQSDGETVLGNSIVAGNAGSERDISGSITDQGFNLVGVMDPRLGLLQDNGGPTETHAPLAGSPALDRGFSKDNSQADQRGVERPQDDPMVVNAGDGSDIGAVEARVPKASIGDVTVTEGTGGTLDAVFNVRLSESEVSTRIVTIRYATQDDEATSPGDYSPAEGTLTFGASDEAVSKTVAVGVEGDASDEPTEAFLVNLSSTEPELIADGSAFGIVRDDDDPPALSVSDATATEASSGSTGADFQVSLSTPSGKPVSVNYATSDGTATAASGDYSQTSGTVYLSPGTTSKSVQVPVNSDTKGEPQETFFVSLSSPENATLARDKGEGTIVDSPPDNGAPTAGGDSYSTGQDQTLRVSAPGLLGNDDDPEGGSLTAVEATDPAHGEVFVRADGSFAYFPEAGYLGADSFTYKASDGPNSSDLATVEISVRDVTPPEVLSMTPPGSRAANVTVRFSEPMDPATLMQDASNPVGRPSISQNVILLKGGPTSTTQVPARVSCAEETCRTVILDPDARLGARKTYTVRVEGTAGEASSPGVKDTGGNGLAQDYVKSFKTKRN